MLDSILFEVSPPRQFGRYAVDLQVTMKRRLSTIFTPVWRLYVFVWIALCFLFSIHKLWKFLMIPENAAPLFSIVKLIGFILFALVSSVFVNYMGGSLKRVYIDGDILIVSNYLKKIEIPISQIRHVEGPDWTTLRRITLYLCEPSAFGDEIIFAPGFFDAGNVANELKDWVSNMAGKIKRRSVA